MNARSDQAVGNGLGALSFQSGIAATGALDVSTTQNRDTGNLTGGRPSQNQSDDAIGLLGQLR